MVWGGNDKSSHFLKLQRKIIKLIQVDGKDNDEGISHNYKRLLMAIKANDVCFNIENKSQDVHGQSNVDVIVEKMLMVKDV